MSKHYMICFCRNDKNGTVFIFVYQNAFKSLQSSALFLPVTQIKHNSL